MIQEYMCETSLHCVNHVFGSDIDGEHFVIISLHSHFIIDIVPTAMGRITNSL